MTEPLAPVPIAMRREYIFKMALLLAPMLLAALLLYQPRIASVYLPIVVALLGWFIIRRLHPWLWVFLQLVYQRVAVRDTSAAAPALPESLLGQRLQLEMLGFEAIGTYEVMTPIKMGSNQAWVYVSEDHTVVAELIQMRNTRSALGFTTYKADRQLMTRYPSGIRYDADGSRYGAARGTPEGAYRYHRAQVAQWHTGDAPLERIDTVADLLRERPAVEKAWRQMQRRNFNHLLAVTSVQVAMWPALAFIIAASVALIVLRVSVPIEIQHLLLLIGPFIITLAFNWFTSRGVDTRSYLRKPKPKRTGEAAHG